MAHKDKKSSSSKHEGKKSKKDKARIMNTDKANRDKSNGVKPTEAIAKRKSQLLAKPERHFTVGSLEEALLKIFPAQDAQTWDRTGLSVGERALPVSSVAVALDPTVSAIEEAAKINADVLITHHPLFLNPPDNFEPASSVAVSSGAGVWAAIKNRIAVMSFHTALDVSRQAQSVLPNMLGLIYKGQLLQPLASSKQKGFGAICKVPAIEGTTQTLAQLSARCMSVFGRPPRVWGNLDAPIKDVVTATGSASSLTLDVANSKVDCLICGEIKYHSALELSEAGIAIIELGHDVSELPLAAVLANTLSEIGFSTDWIAMIDQSRNWTIPETIRL